MQSERSEAKIGQSHAAAESVREAPLSNPSGYARFLAGSICSPA